MLLNVYWVVEEFPEKSAVSTLLPLCIARSVSHTVIGELHFQLLVFVLDWCEKKMLYQVVVGNGHNHGLSAVGTGARSIAGLGSM